MWEVDSPKDTGRARGNYILPFCSGAQKGKESLKLTVVKTPLWATRPGAEDCDTDVQWASPLFMLSSPRCYVSSSMDCTPRGRPQ